MVEQLTEIICRVGEIKTLAPDEDYREVGVASVNQLLILMEIEETLGISIPDDLFIRARTVRDLQIIDDLKNGVPR